MCHRLAFRGRGLSLIELLVVITIITLLLAMLVPGVSATRERLRRLVCANNLRQWGHALQYYRDDNEDYIPAEGTYLNYGVRLSFAWYNALPPYLDVPAYRDFDREIVNNTSQIREQPDLHVWICPSKNRTAEYKSASGKNQFHYGMNLVLDGMDSWDTPDFPDQTRYPIKGHRFADEPNTVYMFDIAPNSMAGSPRDVATCYARDWQGRRMPGEFHGDYLNLLLLNGGVVSATSDDIVTNHDFFHGDIIWHHPRLYWGYRPPPVEP